MGEHHHTFHEGRHTPYLPTCRALQHYGTTGYYSTTFLQGLTEDFPYSSRVPNNVQLQLVTQELCSYTDSPVIQIDQSTHILFLYPQSQQSNVDTTAILRTGCTLGI